jgi:Zinc finger, C4 type (two domains)
MLLSGVLLQLSSSWLFSRPLLLTESIGSSRWRSPIDRRLWPIKHAVVGCNTGWPRPTTKMPAVDQKAFGLFWTKRVYATVNSDHRNACRACRFRRCIDSGMKRDCKCSEAHKIRLDNRFAFNLAFLGCSLYSYPSIPITQTMRLPATTDWSVYCGCG